MRTRPLIAAFTLAVTVTAAAVAAPREAAGPKPDLADMAQGGYDGDVISDARGAGRPGVHVTVTKVGPNRVSVSSDYPRLAPFTAKLARYMQTIQIVGGPQVFLLDLSKSPRTLGITDDDASWSGRKAGGE